MRIVNKKSLRILVIPSFEILNQNLPQRIFQMWSDTRKRIVIFFKWFKPSRAENRMCIAHDRHPYLMFFGAILPLEVDEPKHKGDKSIFKLYRVFPLPRFYLSELSRGNFGAIPQPNRGKMTSYCGITEGNPRVGPAATTQQMGL